MESGLFRFKKYIPKANVWHVTYRLDEIWLYLIIFLFLSDIDLCSLSYAKLPQTMFTGTYPEFFREIVYGREFGGGRDAPTGFMAEPWWRLKGQSPRKLRRFRNLK